MCDLVMYLVFLDDLFFCLMTLPLELGTTLLLCIHLYIFIQVDRERKRVHLVFVYKGKRKFFFAKPFSDEKCVMMMAVVVNIMKIMVMIMKTLNITSFFHALGNQYVVLREEATQM